MKMMKYIVSVLQFILIHNLGNCQLASYLPVNIYDVMINNEDIEHVDIFSIENEEVGEFQLSACEIDRAKRVIRAQHYSYPNGEEESVFISTFNENWLIKSTEGTSADGELIWLDTFEYEKGLLVRKKELKTNWFSAKEGDEVVVKKKEFFYRYGVDHNEALEIICYTDWEEQKLSYKERYEYKFDDDGRMTYKLIERSNTSDDVFKYEGEFYWDYGKKKTVCEHYESKPDRVETLVEIYDDSNILIRTKYENYAAGKEFRLEYNEDGLIAGLTTIHKYNGRKSFHYKSYEYTLR